MNRLFLVSFWLLVLVGVILAQQPIEVDGFQQPLNGEISQTCEYGIFGACFFTDQYHLADDFGDVSVNDPVYASARGIIKEAQFHNGYGGTVLIEHKLPSSVYVVSLYAHLNNQTLAVSTNDVVERGDLIGYIAKTGNTPDGNGGNYEPHLHFGLHKHSYSQTPTYACDGEWSYHGYTSDPCDLVEWYNPSDFFGVGFFSDNWYSDGTSQAILDRYVQAANVAHPLGSPWDNDGGLFVHGWYDVTLQDFKGDNTNYYHGYTAIILNPSGTAAYLVKEGFWDWYMRHEGYRNLGAPTSEEYQAGNSTKQDFELGRLVWDYTSVYATYLNDQLIPTQDVIIKPDPPTAIVWHNGEKMGQGNFSIALYEGFDYEFQVKENGYEVGTQNISVPSTTSEINPDLSPGSGVSPDNFPLTVQAENMDGLGIPIANGMNLTSQNWYIGPQPLVYFSGAGWVEVEVRVKANGQVNGEWPYLKYEAFGYIAPQEVSSTDWIKLYYLFEVAQAVDYWTAVSLADQTKNVSGHSVDVDYVILRYVPGHYIPPTANADESDVPSETPQVIDVVENDTDDDSLDESSVEIIEAPTNGTVEVDTQTGRVIYTPVSGYVGSDEFRYTVRDNEGVVSKNSIVSLGVKKIVVTQPNGGESYGYRDYVDVTWQQDPSIAAVRVEYSTNGGQRWTLVGFVYSGTSKSFRNMQMSGKTECLVRVKNKNDFSEYDDSDAYFTLEGFSRFSKTGDQDDGEEETTVVPSDYILHQNHPNPFNPMTTIRYALPEAGQVKIVIYDLLGQEIRELVNAYQEAGYQQAVWDSRNNQGNKVTSGIYLYRMSAGKFIQTNKLILLR